MLLVLHQKMRSVQAAKRLCAVCCVVSLGGPVPCAGPSAGVFAYAAAQVKAAMDATVRLGGANYVFWCGLSAKCYLRLACVPSTGLQVHDAPHHARAVQMPTAPPTLTLSRRGGREGYNTLLNTDLRYCSPHHLSS